MGVVNMNAVYKCLIIFLILLLAAGFASASDDAGASDGNDTVLSVEKLDNVTSDGAEDTLDYAYDETIGDEAKTHVEVNSYDVSAFRPHSVNIYNDSDYVARVYSPNGSGGSVSVIIGENEDAMEIFNADIQSLYHEVDENDTSFSYFYIKPNDIMGYVDTGFYWVTVVYKYGVTLNSTGEGLVRFVESSEHVSVDVPPEIVIGDVFKSYISIYVEGTLGYIRVLIDNKEIINDSVFDLKYDTETQEFNSFIILFLDDLSIGRHTYNISYYDGNWDDVTFNDTINVTYLLDVIMEADEVYYGDNVTFSIILPDDASSNVIKVNGKTYDIHLEDGFGNLTLSNLSLGENNLTFTYNDVKYGEKSFALSLMVNPIFVPTVVHYGDDDKIMLNLPEDAQGILNITVDNVLIASVNVVDGIANYSLDLWNVGSYNVSMEYDDGKYHISIETLIDVIPNVDFKDNLTIGENGYVSVNIGVGGNITVFVNGNNLTTENAANGKINVSIPSTNMHLGENIITFKYEGSLDKDPFYYYDVDAGSYVPYEYAIMVAPQEFNIPDEFPANGTGNITLELPEGFEGNVTVFVNGEVVSTTRVSGGINNISISGLKAGINDVRVVLTDDNGYSYEVNKDVSVPKPEPQIDIEIPTDKTVPTFTINLPSDATGTFTVDIGGHTVSNDLKNGSVTVTVPGLEDGTYNATLSYSGDGKYAGFIKNVMITIKTVDLKDIKLTIKVSSVYQGKKSVITITTDSAFTGTVNVKINSKTYAVNVIKGKGTKSISGLGVGTYAATATFAGNGVFKSATKSVSFKVKANVIKLTLKKVKVKKSAKKLKIKAILKINGKKAKGKKLKFKFKNKKYTAKTNKKGVAKIVIKKKILKKLKVGKKVKYSVTYGKKTVKRTVKVKR